MSKFTPITGKVIIQPFKPKVIELDELVAVEVETGTPVEDMDTIDRVNPEKPIETEIRAERKTREAVARKAKILAVPIDEEILKVGDTIVYRNNTGMPFELWNKSALLVNRYDVLATVN